MPKDEQKIWQATILASSLKLISAQMLSGCDMVSTYLDVCFHKKHQHTVK